MFSNFLFAQSSFPQQEDILWNKHSPDTGLLSIYIQAQFFGVLEEKPQKVEKNQSHPILMKFCIHYKWVSRRIPLFKLIRKRLWELTLRKRLESKKRFCYGDAPEFQVTVPDIGRPDVITVLRVVWFYRLSRNISINNLVCYAMSRDFEYRIPYWHFTHFP